MKRNFAAIYKKRFLQVINSFFLSLSLSLSLTHTHSASRFHSGSFLIFTESYFSRKMVDEVKTSFDKLGLCGGPAVSDSFLTITL